MNLSQSWQIFFIGLVSAVATSLVLILFPRLWVVIRRIISPVSGFEKKYRQYVRHNLSKISLGGVQGVSSFRLDLQELFISPRLIPQNDQTISNTSSLSLGEVVNSIDQKRIVILGGPGSGKTTLLKYLALEAARGTSQLPIYIPLRETSELIFDLKFERLASQLPLANAPYTFFERKARSGDCLILLDGLDEVSELSRANIIKWIQDITSLYPQNTFIITSRIAGYNTRIAGFTEFELAEFDEKEIRSYIDKWTLSLQLGIQSDTPKARETATARAMSLANVITSNSSIRQLVGNPFFLTLILTTDYFLARLPRRRAELLEGLIAVMLERWDIIKGISEDKFSPRIKRKLLEALALFMQTQKAWNLPTGDIVKLFSKESATLNIASNRVPDIINELIARSGLLVERQPNSIGFSHKVLQEYLAASELSHSNNSEMLLVNLQDAWWQEIIVLYASISVDATKFVSSILNKYEKDPISSKRELILAGRCLLDANIEAPVRNNVITYLRGLVEIDHSLSDQILKILETTGGEDL